MENSYLKSQLEIIDNKIQDAQALISDPEMKELAELEIAELKSQKKIASNICR